MQAAQQKRGSPVTDSFNLGRSSTVDGSHEEEGGGPKGNSLMQSMHQYINEKLRFIPKHLHTQRKSELNKEALLGFPAINKQPTMAIKKILTPTIENHFKKITPKEELHLKPKLKQNTKSKRNNILNQPDAPILIQKPIFLEETSTMLPKSPKKQPMRRDTDSLNFGFNVHKLSKEQTNAATLLMEKQFGKEVGPIAKRKLRFNQDNQTLQLKDLEGQSPYGKDSSQSPQDKSPTKRLLQEQQKNMNHFVSTELLPKDQLVVSPKYQQQINKKRDLEDFIERQQKNKQKKKSNALPVDIQNFIFSCVIDKGEKQKKQQTIMKRILSPDPIGSQMGVASFDESLLRERNLTTLRQNNQKIPREMEDDIERMSKTIDGNVNSLFTNNNNNHKFNKTLMNSNIFEEMTIHDNSDESLNSSVYDKQPVLKLKRGSIKFQASTQDKPALNFSSIISTLRDLKIQSPTEEHMPQIKVTMNQQQEAEPSKSNIGLYEKIVESFKKQETSFRDKLLHNISHNSKIKHHESLKPHSTLRNDAIQIAQSRESLSNSVIEYKRNFKANNDHISSIVQSCSYLQSVYKDPQAVWRDSIMRGFEDIDETSRILENRISKKKLLVMQPSHKALMKKILPQSINGRDEKQDLPKIQVLTESFYGNMNQLRQSPMNSIWRKEGGSGQTKSIKFVF